MQPVAKHTSQSKRQVAVDFQFYLNASLWWTSERDQTCCDIISHHLIKPLQQGMKLSTSEVDTVPIPVENRAARVLGMAHIARVASRILATTSTAQRNRALEEISLSLQANGEAIKAANAEDIRAAKAAAMAPALIDRLTLTDDRIAAMAAGVLQVALLQDPIGTQLGENVRPNGLKISKVRVPLGVIGIIYESRPNVTADSASLCLKSGNAVILRGGSEAIQSNRCLADIMIRAVLNCGLPEGTIQLIQDTDRASSLALMQAEGLVDLLIPRGGNGLKKTVLDNARVPVLTSLGGNCHTFIDATADIQMAVDIAFNAKVSRPSVCNAMETLLIHADVARDVLGQLIPRLHAAGVEVRGCERSCTLYPDIVAAELADWDTEYLALILAVKVVDSVEDAIEHIGLHGTGHSEAIVTNESRNAELFTNRVDAACVYVNASTRFTDGFEFGLGAEVGISTQKLHARGPIGLQELTTYKYVIYGTGQIRA